MLRVFDDTNGIGLMVDLYNRIHQTCAEFEAAADDLAMLECEGRASAIAAFDGHWTEFELAFGGIDSFRMTDRARRTRFLLDLIAAEERDRKAGRLHAASGANLLALLLRGVKYATRVEVDRMLERISYLRGASAYPRLEPAATVSDRIPTVH